MTEWKEETINDVCIKVTDGSHNSPKAVEKGYYMASVKDFRKYDFDFSECKQISEEDYFSLVKSGCVPEKEDILIGKDGARYFEDIIVYEQDEKPALLSSIAILRCDKEKIDPYFLYYMLQVPSVRKDVKDNYGSGSAIPRIILKDFKRMPIRYPSLEIQKSLITILKSIDSKIKLNEKINRNLSEQAQSYFEELFVQNASSDWKQGILSDIGTIVAGGTPSKAKEEYYTENGIAWITPKDLSVDKSMFISHGENDITELGLQKSSATMMPAGTVLFSSRAPIGYIAIAANEVSTNQGFKSVVPKVNVGTAYIYYLLKKLLPTIEGMASGSTFKEISGAAMKIVPIVIPDDNTLKRFNDFCRPIMLQIKKNENESKKLAELRDILLPKLMSGEFDVSDLEM